MISYEKTVSMMLSVRAIAEQIDLNEPRNEDI